MTEPDGRPGEWYLHLFTPEQPDLDWTHPEVRADFEKTLGFWFDRGVDGFRIDVAHSLAKQEGLPDLAGGPGGHPAWDRDEVHQIYREWRAIADAYPEPRVFVAEAWVDQPERLARYVRPDELHTAFNCFFQGEELGLPEVEDLPVEALDDPVWERSGRTDRGRDGCRVPIPWEGGGPPYGFSPPGTTAPPWLPQPPGWDDLAVAVQSGDRGSMLELYRAALGLRRGHPALGDGALRWLEAPAGALAFARDPGFACLVNVSGPPAPLPAGAAPLLASGPLTPEGAVPEDTAVWLRR